MNKKEFLEKLRFELKRKHIQDIDEIIEEYNEHFNQKHLNGESEEEIANKLAKPAVLAKEYETNQENNSSLKFQSVTTGIGLSFIDIIMFSLTIIMFSGILVLAVFSLLLLVLSICLLLNINIADLIPYMPYYGKILYSVTIFTFSIIWTIITVYSYLFSKQWVMIYLRWRKNIMSNRRYPKIELRNAITKLPNQMIRKITLQTLTVFGVFSIISTVILMAVGGIEFWHTWKWFQ